MITEYALPEHALSETFLAATGPGGQNVNKVATAVQLRVNVYALRLLPHVFARLKQLAGSKWPSAKDSTKTKTPPMSEHCAS